MLVGLESVETYGLLAGPDARDRETPGDGPGHVGRREEPGVLQMQTGRRL